MNFKTCQHVANIVIHKEIVKYRRSLAFLTGKFSDIFIFKNRPLIIVSFVIFFNCKMAFPSLERSFIFCDDLVGGFNPGGALPY